MYKFIRAVWFQILSILFVVNYGCEYPEADLAWDKVGRQSDWSEVLVVPLATELNRARLDQIKKELAEAPNTIAVSALSDIPTKFERKVKVKPRVGSGNEWVDATILYVDYDFCEALQIMLDSGREFTRDSPNDTSSFMINDELARKLGLDTWEAYGKELILQDHTKEQNGKLVGVLKSYRIRVYKDWNLLSDRHTRVSIPMIFKIDTSKCRYLIIRTNNTSETLAFLEDKSSGLPLQDITESFILGDRVPDLSGFYEKNSTTKLYIINSILITLLLATLIAALTKKQKALHLLFRMKGRITRGKYFLLMIGTSIIFWVIVFINVDKYSLGAVRDVIGTFTTVLIGASILVAVIAQISLIVKRLHDIERHSSHFWLFLIPLYNVYLAFLLLLKKGTPGANKYG